MKWPTIGSRNQLNENRKVSGGAPPPFLLELRCEEITPNGKFTPSALVALNSAWLETEWVRTIGTDDLLTLLLVMACVTPNGRFEATPQRLAPLMGRGLGATRQRMERLTSIYWGGAPLLEGAVTVGGMERFWPTPALLEVSQRTLGPPPLLNQMVQPVPPAEIVVPSSEQGQFGQPTQEESVLAPITGSSPVISSPTSPTLGRREQVIAYSRATYGRPRALVEAEIAEFLKPISSVRPVRGAPQRQFFSASPAPNAPIDTPGIRTVGGKSGREGRDETDVLFEGETAVKAEVNAAVNSKIEAENRDESKGSVRGEVETERNASVELASAITVDARAEVDASGNKVSPLEPGITPETRAWHALKRRLVGAGLLEEQASALLDTYPIERIERQVGWLPYRYARKPAFYLIAAIKGDYAAPARIALQNLPPVESLEANEGTASKVARAESPASTSTPASHENRMGSPLDAYEHNAPESNSPAPNALDLSSTDTEQKEAI